MPPNSNVKTSLIKILNSSRDTQPGRVFLLSGPWGAGKTYFWKNVITPSLERPHIYISAFGAESSTQLKTRLVTQFAIAATEDIPGSGKLKEKTRSFWGRIFSPNAAHKSSRLLLAATDTAFNALLSKFSLDPVELSELVNSKTVICIDDIERTSSKYKIDELLGIANILSEHKGFDVVLVCNEDYLLSIDKTAAQVYLRYKEKTVSVQYRIDPDFDMVFDNILSSLDEPLRKQVQQRKDRILGLMRHCGSSNIRTLRRAFDYLSTLHGLGISKVSDAQTDLLVALTIEAAEGRLEDVEFYEFDAFAVRMSGSLRGRQQEISDLQKKRIDFLRRFNLEESYSFIRSLYSLVRGGDVDADALKLAFEPPDPTRSEIEVLLGQARRVWHIYSDEQAFDLMNRLCNSAAVAEGISAVQIVDCLLYARLLSEILEIDLDPTMAARIKERLGVLAANGDTSISPIPSPQIMYGDLADHVLDEVKYYLDTFKQHEANKEFARLTGLLRDGRFEELASALYRPETTRLFLERGGMADVLLKASESAELLISVVGSIGESLKALRGTWSDAEKNLKQLVDALKAIQSMPERVGKMQAWRAKYVLGGLIPPYS